MTADRAEPGSPAAVQTADWLANGGAMAQVIAQKDWAQTPLGPLSSWPQSLRTTVSLCLASNFPISLAWGPQCTQIYNDGYWPICAAKHPSSMGQDFRECWASAWPAIGEAFERALSGETSFLENQRMFLDRNGYLEETFFTFSFSPIRDESGGIGGLFHPVTETTSKMLSERRTRTLKDLTAALAAAQSIEDVLRVTSSALRGAEFDLPFVLIYGICTNADPRLIASCGLSREVPPLRQMSPSVESLGDLSEVLKATQICHCASLSHAFAQAAPGPYAEPPAGVVLIPIKIPGRDRADALLAAGVSARLAMDEQYRAFYTQVGAAVTAAAVNASVLEEEHKRAAVLAELDRAKTTFFSNVSHEFRTPLTLMMGPLEDALSEPALSDPQRHRLELAHRNCLRLLKLVNSLLEFSRIEAGRTQASYVSTDLAALTTDLASSFRSAIEKAGLVFDVKCESLPAAAYVDRDMWEKVVLNLVSNAFKFTFEGRIEVSLRQIDSTIHLTVRDTGVGIPPSELPHLFERFRRVENTRSRTFEGTGIGLALVQELTYLHGGAVKIESVEGEGSAFTVCIQAGRAHLPPDRIAAERALTSTATRTDAYLSEAQGWVSQAAGASTVEAPERVKPAASGDQTAPAPEPRLRVLLADDNADMRVYVTRLLSERYDVLAVPDGEEAHRAVIEQMPDLVLSDVMMPKLDGFGLLQRLRSDPRTEAVPIILLSARAGEEAYVEGLAAGADDYLIKPFGARELLARVHANLKLAKLRQETQRALGRQETLEEDRRRKDEFIATLSHELRNPLSPLRNAIQILSRDESRTATDRRLLAMMDRQVTQLVRLVDDLMALTRLNRGTFDLRSERVDLSAVVQNAIEMNHGLLQARGHRLTVSLPVETLWLEGDAIRLGQILGNLLNNACKYTPPGGSIAIAVSQTDSAVTVSVRDSGIGIAPADVDRVFEMFTSAKSPTLEGSGGLGVGLALSRRLALLHGGSLTVKSEGVGKGCEFILTLRQALEHSGGAAEAGSRAADLRPQRVLVVDDNRDAADSLMMILEALGAQVRVAYAGREALDALAHYDAGVVVLDIGMPGMDGYEVAQAIRAQDQGRTRILIALTGWGQEADRVRALQAGFDHHIVKPVEISRLRALLAGARVRTG